MLMQLYFFTTNPNSPSYPTGRQVQKLQWTVIALPVALPSASLTENVEITATLCMPVSEGRGQIWVSAASSGWVFVCVSVDTFVCLASALQFWNQRMLWGQDVLWHEHIFFSACTELHNITATKTALEMGICAMDVQDVVIVISHRCMSLQRKRFLSIGFLWRMETSRPKRKKGNTGKRLLVIFPLVSFVYWLTTDLVYL